MNKIKITNVINYFFIIMLFYVSMLNAFTITTFPNSDFDTDTIVMDKKFGIANYTIEDFEDVNLVDNLLIQVGNNTKMSKITQVYDPQKWGKSVWDGKYVLLNSTDNAWNTPQHNFRSRITFYIVGGTTSFGIGLSNFQRGSTQNHPILINGKKCIDNVGSFANYTDYVDEDSSQNIYVRIDANSGERIESVSFGYDGSAVDGLIFDHLAFDHDISPSDLNINLISYYPFDGNANDVSGNGYHGDENGGNDYEKGIKYESKKFDGSDNWINLKKHPFFDLKNSNFCISYWVKPFSQPTYFYRFITRRNSNSAYNATIIHGITKNNFEFNFYYPKDSNNNSQSYGNDIFSCPLSLNIWHHFIFTRNNDKLYFYVNGQLIEIKNVENHTYYYDKGNAYIGRDIFPGGTQANKTYGYFDGLIDEIKLFNRFISEKEVNAIYEYNKPIDLKKGLIAHYEFEQNLNDSSGNDFHGMAENEINYINGIKGFSAYFDGKTSITSIDNNKDIIPFNDDSRTISVWAKMIEGMDSHDDQFIAGYGEADSNKMFAIQYGLGKSYNYGVWLFGCNNDLSCNERGDAGKANYIKNKYYHIVTTYSKPEKSLKLYINGKLSESKTTSTISTTKSYIYIGGCSALDSKYYFNGYLDDLRIYNRNLTQTEVNALYLHSFTDEIVDLENGLIVYYEFEDNTDDSSDNAIHGTTSSNIIYQNGVIGKSAYLNGIDDYISIGKDNILDIGNGDFTLTAWIKTQSNSMQHILQRYSGENDKDYYEMKIESDYKFNLRLKESQTTNNFDNNQTSTISKNNWHFLTCIKDQTSISLYIDGYLVASKGNSINPSTPDVSTIIGRNSFNQSDYFHGNIDDLRIYNRVLSQSEINVLSLMGDSSIVENVEDQNSQTPDNISLVDMDYMNEKYFAVGGTKIFTSHFGDRFIHYYQTENNEKFRAIKCNNDSCLSVGDNGLVVEIEGGNANEIDTHTNNHFLDVSGDGNYTFIAVGVNGTIIKYFALVPEVIELKTNADLTSIIYDNSQKKYYITTSDGHIFISSDGRNWEQKYITSKSLSSIEINNDVIVITCEDGSIFTSVDKGKTFTQPNSNISDKLIDIHYINNRFATVTHNSLFTSEDGLTWHQDNYDFKNETIQGVFIDKYKDINNPALILMTDSAIHTFEKFNNIKTGETKKATLGGVTIEFEKSKIKFENGYLKEFLIEPDDTMHIFQNSKKIAKLTFTGLSDFKLYKELKSSLAISIFLKKKKYIEILGENILWYKAGTEYIPVSAGDFWLKDSKIHEKPLLHKLSDQGYNSLSDDFETVADHYENETFDKLSDKMKKDAINPDDYRKALQLILNTFHSLSFDMPITKNRLLLGNPYKFISPKTFTIPFFRWLYIDTQDGKLYQKESTFFFIHKFFLKQVLGLAINKTILPEGLPKLEFVVDGAKLKGTIKNLELTPGPFQIQSTKSTIESNLIDDNADDIIYINDALFSFKDKLSNFRKINYNRTASLGAKITKLKLTYNKIDGLKIVSGEAGGEFKIPKYNINKNWSLENLTAYLGLVIREKDSQGNYVVSDVYPNELDEMIVVTSGSATLRHRSKSYIDQPSDLQIEGSIKLAFDENSLNWDTTVDNHNLMEFKINTKNAVSFPKKGAFSVNGFGLQYQYNKTGSYWSGIVNFDLYKLKNKYINLSLFQGSAALSARLNLTSIGLGINTFETDLRGTGLYIDWVNQSTKISKDALACVLIGDIPPTMPVNCPVLSDCNNQKFSLKPDSTPVNNKDIVFTGFGAGASISFNLKKRNGKTFYSIGDFIVKDIINGSFGFQIHGFKGKDASMNDLAAHFFLKGKFTLPRAKKNWFFIPSILKGKPLGEICASIGNFKVTEEISHVFSKSNVNLGTHLGFYAKVTIGENKYPLFIPISKLIDNDGDQIFITTTMKLKRTNIKRRIKLNIGDTIESSFFVNDNESFVLIDLVSNDNSISLQTPDGDIITENSTNLNNFEVIKEDQEFTDITIQNPKPGTYKLSYKHTGNENITIFGANNIPKATMNISATSVGFSLSDADLDEIQYSLSILDNNFEFAYQLSEGKVSASQTLSYDINKIKQIKHLNTGDYYIAIFYSDELSPVQELISNETIRLEKEIIAPQNLNALVTNEYVNLFWDHDPAADEYHISLLSNGQIMFEYRIEANTLQIPDLLFGEYQVNVCGYDNISNIKGQISSVTFNVEETTTSFIPESVKNIRLEVTDGIAKIVWDKVNNADFYSTSLSYGSDSIFKNVITINNSLEINSDYYGLDLTFSIAALNKTNNASEVNTKTISIYTKQDDDSDGLSDMWEMRYFNNLFFNGKDDFDRDGLSNAQEYSMLTNPSIVDSDEDNTNDSIDPHPTMKIDKNVNSVADDWESVYHITDIMADDDGDGYTNYVEYWAGLSPSDYDDVTINIDKIVAMDFMPVIKSNTEKISIVRLNQLVNIDLSSSFDINGDTLSYDWIINGRTIESVSSCLTLDTSKTGMYRVEVNIKDSKNSVYRKYSVFVTDGRKVKIDGGKENDISFSKYTIHLPSASMINDSYLVAGEISKKNIPVKIMGREIVTDGIIYLYSEGYRLETPVTIIPYIKDDEIIDPYIFNYSTSIWTNLNTGEIFDPIFNKMMTNDGRQYRITTKETGILLFARKPRSLKLSSITTIDTKYKVYSVDLNKYMLDNNLVNIEEIKLNDNSIVNVHKGLVDKIEELRIDIVKPGITELQIIALNSDGAKVRFTYIVEIQRAKFSNNLVNAITLLKLCSGIDPYYDFSELDFNNNGKVDLADAIYLLQQTADTNSVNH